MTQEELNSNSALEIISRLEPNYDYEDRINNSLVNERVRHPQSQSVISNYQGNHFNRPMQRQNLYSRYKDNYKNQIQNLDMPKQNLIEQFKDYAKGCKHHSKEHTEDTRNGGQDAADKI